MKKCKRIFSLVERDHTSQLPGREINLEMSHDRISSDDLLWENVKRSKDSLLLRICFLNVM